MQLKINSQILEKLLGKALLAVPARSPMQALENFKIEIKENKISVTGSDLINTVIVSEKINTDMDTEFLVPAKVLYDLVSSCEEELKISIFKEEIKIETEHGNYKLPVLEAIDYPASGIIKGEELQINLEELAKGMEFLGDCIATDDLRPAMGGVLFQLKGSKLKLVATDGHKLGIYNAEYETDKKNHLGKDQIIIPGEVISIIKKFSAKGGEGIITYNKTHLQLVVNDDIIITRLIGEVFPAFEKVMPQDNNIEALISRKQTLKAVKRLNLLGDGSNVTLLMHFKKNSMELSVQNDEYRKYGAEKYPCEYSGGDLKVGFDIRFLLSTISKFDAEKINLSLKSSTSAVIVTEPDNEKLYSLIMPVRIQGE